MDPQQQAAIDHAQTLMLTMIPFFIGFGFIMMAVMIIPFWQIFKKAGFPAPLSLLMVLPLVSIIMLYVLAFSRWKVVPAPEYPLAGYPPPYPPTGYVPAASGPYQPPPPPAPPTI